MRRGDVPPAARLARAFGLDDTTARSLASSLPRVVKHGVAAPQAGEMRRVLESIGAEVECRPARRSKPVTNPNGAVFQKPSDDLLPGRVSAIDPFAPAASAGMPRISVGDPTEDHTPTRPSEVSGAVHPPSAVPPRTIPKRSVEDAIREGSLARQRRTFMRRAIGAVVGGVILAGIGLVMNNSVFLGNANYFGVAVDGIAIYLLGVGGRELYMLRS